MIDYYYIFGETLSHYFEDEWHFPLDSQIKVKTDKIEADTLDEYLVYLIEGYINVTLEERLEKYLVELIKEKRFHHWAPIRWAYASRILHNEKSSDDDINLAVSILFPLAREGYPNALCDIASCYCYGNGLERSYERAICLWVIASRKGCRKANEYLQLEYELSRSKELNNEMRLFLVNRMLWFFIEEHGIRVENSVIITDNLPAGIEKSLRKIYNEHKKLCKFVLEKAYLRNFGKLCWEDEDNPYSIGINRI